MSTHPFLPSAQRISYLLILHWRALRATNTRSLRQEITMDFQLHITSTKLKFKVVILVRANSAALLIFYT
jgi:hypothetical protein